ncbi:MAG: hypothetical protein L6R39_001213 [Caloplaca ligustica]|nr:MAG: hypothetical protein L6R39_001213 [Caloplaca ligustica]
MKAGDQTRDSLHTSAAPKDQYAPSRKGILSILPTACVPYAELMRLEKPAGLYAFYFPYIIGICYAACIRDSPPSLERMMSLACLFLVWSVILRGAACSWNDNIDQEFDRKVLRCRLRPIARGAVSTAQGHLFTAALCLAEIPILLYLPAGCTYHAVPVTILFMLYPFAKRVTYYPQVILGFPFAWAIFICCTALEVDPFHPQVFASAACLFMANVSWTIIYDTIYAHQDIKDDVAAGVKSMAVRFAHSTKLLTSILAAAQVTLLLVAGRLARLSSLYFIASCGGAAFALTNMIVRVDLEVPASCAGWFHRGFWYVGGSIAIGLFGAYLERQPAWNAVHHN